MNCGRLFTLLCFAIASLSFSAVRTSEDTLVLRGKAAQVSIALGGGGITEFRLADESTNPLNWEISQELEPKQAGKPYLRGHFLCLDRWGAPSDAEKENVLVDPENVAPELGLPSAGPLRQMMFPGAEEALRLEAVRALADRADPVSQELFRSIATDRSLEIRVRAEAIRGLAHSANSSIETRNALLGILHGEEYDLKRESLRSLRGLFARPDIAAALRLLSHQVNLADNLELAEQLWLAAQPDPQKVLAKQFCVKAREAKFGRPDYERDLRLPQGDPESGQRVFFHVRGPQCFTCHRVNDRGGVAGPDLSHIAQKLHACKLHESIIDPSKEIAPQFTTWLITTHQGQVLTGIILSEDASGDLTLASAKGEHIQLRASDIEERQAQKTSIMPENLRDQMTWQELWDVVAYLGELQ